MPTRSSHRSLVTILLAFLVCWSLLFSTFAFARLSQSSVTDQTQLSRGNPEVGPPPVTLPNLDEVRRMRHPKPEAPPHIPSLMRGRRKPLEPRKGRKVGDPGTTEGALSGDTAVPSASSLTAQTQVGKGGTPIGLVPVSARPSYAVKAKSNHAGRSGNFLSLTGIADIQYVKNFFQSALARQPYTSVPNEEVYWDDILRAALTHGQGAPVMAVREMGKTLFESV